MTAPVHYKELFPIKNKNFNQCPMTVVTWQLPPFVEVINKSNGEIEFSGNGARCMSDKPLLIASFFSIYTCSEASFLSIFRCHSLYKNSAYLHFFTDYNKEKSQNLI